MGKTEKIPDPNPKLGDESTKKKRKRKRSKNDNRNLVSAAEEQVEEVNEIVESDSDVIIEDLEKRVEEEYVDEVKKEEKEQVDEVEEEKEVKKKKKKVKVGSGIMSSVTFESMGLSEPTMKAIKDMGFHYTTEVSNTNTQFFEQCVFSNLLSVCYCL